MLTIKQIQEHEAEGAELVKGECEFCGYDKLLFYQEDSEPDDRDRLIRYGRFECIKCTGEMFGDI